MQRKLKPLKEAPLTWQCIKQSIHPSVLLELTLKLGLSLIQDIESLLAQRDLMDSMLLNPSRPRTAQVVIVDASERGIEKIKMALRQEKELLERECSLDAPTQTQMFPISERLKLPSLTLPESDLEFDNPMTFIAPKKPITIKSAAAMNLSRIRTKHAKIEKVFNQEVSIKEKECSGNGIQVLNKKMIAIDLDIA